MSEMVKRVEVIDRVARAIYHAGFENRHGGRQPEPGWCWERAGEVQQEFATRQARAALAAIRMPTDAMVEAGYETLGDCSVSPLMLTSVWRAMIDAMIKEDTA